MQAADGAILERHRLIVLDESHLDAKAFVKPRMIGFHEVAAGIFEASCGDQKDVWDCQPSSGKFHGTLY